MTVVILLFGEISPKTLAKESPELTALRTAPLLRFFIIIFTPLNYLAAAWKRFITRIFPAKQDRSSTEDELLTYVEEVRQEGGINRQEEQMIRQVIEFDDIKVSGIFTPRADVAAISQTSAIEEIDRKFAETGFSRLPVFRDTIDDITGIILFKDFHREVMKGLKTPSQIIKPVVFVTKTIKIAKLLKTLQEKQSHLAVVVDEHGGTLGIVTIEDIVEELVGEIWDEHDQVMEPVQKADDGSFKALGSVNFADMLEAVTKGIAHNDEDIPDTTVANWIMENLGRLPSVGEKLTWRNLTIQVSKVLRHRVMEVNVRVDTADDREAADGKE
jgi:CBS domain containing-hemolysin-like protein